MKIHCLLTLILLLSTSLFAQTPPPPPTNGQLVIPMKQAGPQWLYGVTPVTNKVLGWDGTKVIMTEGGGGGTGTVTNVSVVTANGVSGSVAMSTTTPAITLTLGNITPSGVAAVGTVTGSNLSGTNTGDQTTITGNAGSATVLQTPRTIGITGDLTYTSPAFDGSGNVTAAGTLATVNSNVGTFGGASSVPTFTVNAKGLITAASQTAVSVPIGSVTATNTARLFGTPSTGTTGSEISINYINSPFSISAAQLNFSITNALQSLSTTRGAIPIRGSVGWGVITPGTSGFVLTSNGSGADPTYQALPSGGLTVGTTTISGGTNGRFLYNNAGVLGESANVALTNVTNTFTAANNTKAITILQAGTASTDGLRIQDSGGDYGLIYHQGGNGLRIFSNQRITFDAPAFFAGGTTSIATIDNGSGILNSGGNYGGAVGITDDLQVQGALAASPGTITTSKPLSVTQTWNNAATTFTGLSVDITTTASAAGSDVFAVRADGTEIIVADDAFGNGIRIDTYLGTSSGVTFINGQSVFQNAISSPAGVTIGYNSGFLPMNTARSGMTVAGRDSSIAADGDVTIKGGDTGVTNDNGGGVRLLAGAPNGTGIPGAITFETSSVTLGSFTTNLGLSLTKTITVGGTTGAQTINKTTGSVNFAAGAMSLVVTNSLCTTSSVIICTVGTNDIDMSSVKAVPANGSFTLYPDTPPAAETKVFFMITN